MVIDIFEKNKSDKEKEDSEKSHSKEDLVVDEDDLRSCYKHFNEIVNVENTYITRENANMNSNTPSGMMMKIASESSKEYTDRFLIKNKKVLYCIKNNLLHIHDKDYYPTRSLTCIH